MLARESNTNCNNEISIPALEVIKEVNGFYKSDIGLLIE
jgi:hypothetical protein